MKGQTDYEKFKLIRPLPQGFEKDQRGFPTLKKDDNNDVDWNTIKFTSFSNLAQTKEASQTIALMFQYDEVLDRIWNDPLKYANKFREFLAVATPDFSAYTNMEPIQIEHNIYKNRWLGCLYQSLGIRVVPTITWADERTYKACFSGVPQGSIVAISTVGCASFQEQFLKGFNEMKKRINPELILVRGKVIKGMTGNLLVIDFQETFNVEVEYEQLQLFKMDRVISIKETN